jgi:hypothetical protein
MAEIVQSLFGITPEMYQQSQQAMADQQAFQYAQLTPFQQANYAIGRGASMLGGAIGGALGAQDPQLALITARQQISKQINYADPASIARGVELLQQAGDGQGAMMLADVYRKAESESALAAQRKAQAGREAKQAVPNDIQIANEIASLETSLLDIENTPDSPDRTRAKNLLNSRLAALRGLTSKEKPLAPNIKEVGVAKGTDKAVYLDVNNDLQFIYEKNAEGKQVRVPFTGGIDRTTAKTTNQIPLGDVLQKVFQSRDAEDSAKSFTQAGEAYTITIPLIDKLKTVENTVNNAFTGTGSSAKLALSKGLSSIGVKISDRATDTEIADAVSAQVVQQIAKVFPGSQSNKELDQLLKSKFNLQQELPTILRLVGQIKDEMLAQTKTYEQMANLPANDRLAFNAKLAQGQNYQKIQQYRNLEKKYLSGKITAEERAAAAKLKQELNL